MNKPAAPYRSFQDVLDSFQTRLDKAKAQCHAKEAECAAAGMALLPFDAEAVWQSKPRIGKLALDTARRWYEQRTQELAGKLTAHKTAAANRIKAEQIIAKSRPVTMPPKSVLAPKPRNPNRVNNRFDPASGQWVPVE